MHEETHENLVVNAGCQMIGDMLIDAAGWDTGLTYIAIGTGTATPTAANTALATEYSREAIISKSRSGQTITVGAFWAAAEAAIDIKEVGAFGHSTAGTALGSGQMFARTLVSSADNSGTAFDVNIDWQFTLAGV
jgi:hypothetical protein